MKKIMFNDKFSLTQAVIDGRKTQTRRLLTLTLHKKTDVGNRLIEVHPSKVFFEDGKWKFVYDDYVFLLPNEFFCMDLVSFLFSDKEANFLEMWAQAKNGECPYRDRCKRHERTMARINKQPLQLKLF